MTSCVAYDVDPIGLRATMLNMLAAKCVHYEKCITQMDFQYHPNGWKSSEMQLLTSQIQKGWLSSRKECSSPLIPYHESRSELIEENGLVFRGERLVVPPSLRTDMLKEIHRSHIGMNGCLRRARELLFWPRTNAEVKDFVSKCSI